LRLRFAHAHILIALDEPATGGLMLRALGFQHRAGSARSPQDDRPPNGRSSIHIFAPLSKETESQSVGTDTGDCG
jgi:hypothetical protein